MSNRVLALRDLGRDAEAGTLGERLARLDPHPPFSYFKQGMAALREGPARSRAAPVREGSRARAVPPRVRVLARGDLHRAERPAARRQHLKRAMEVSTTRKDHDLYAGKLDRLKALRMQ